MPQLKIATWNINSIRIRLPQLLNWLSTVQPDIVALQETKVEDKDFPHAEITAAGYQVVYAGQKSYNGVAILSRIQIQDVNVELPGVMDEQKRTLAATIQGIRVLNLYVPNGEHVASEKYQYKLRWLEQVGSYIRQQLAHFTYFVVLGDFNIAPTDQDVHDPIAWQGHVLVSFPERQAFCDLLQAGFHDCFRLFNQLEGHYSWWDYRAAAFRRNHGLRIDHILATKALAQYCKSCWVDKEIRQLDRPSDHAPVLAIYELPI